MLGLNKKENKIFRACLVGHLLLGAGFFFSGLLLVVRKNPKKFMFFNLRIRQYLSLSNHLLSR